MTKKKSQSSAFIGSYQRVTEALATYAEWRYLFLLIGLLLVMFLGNSSFLEVGQGSEARIAGVGWSMAESGDLFVPKLNGKPLLDYPPSYYICQSAFFKMLGPTALAAKFPAMLSAIIGAVALYFLVRAMKYSAVTAFLSGLILASSSQYYGTGMNGKVDSMLTMFCILAWWGFYAWGVKEQKRWRYLWFGLLVIGLAGGMMTKNLLGLVIPLSGIGIFMVINDIINRCFHIGRFAMLAIATLLALMPFSLYCYSLYHDFGIAPIRTLLIDNNFGRFIGSVGGEDSEPFYFYVNRIFMLFQPWLIFLVVAIPFHYKRVVKKHSLNSLYALCILLVPFLLLSIASSKRYVYLLPLCGPDAILVGTMFGMFVDGKIIRFSDHVNDLIIRISFYVIFALGVATPITFIVLGIYFDLHGFSRYWAAILMLILTFRVWQLAKPRQEELLLKYLAVIFALIYPNITGIAMAHLDSQESMKSMFVEAKTYKQLYLDRPEEDLLGAAVFYTNKVMPVINLDKDVNSVHEGAAVITQDEQFLLDNRWSYTLYNDKYYLVKCPYQTTTTGEKNEENRSED